MRPAGLAAGETNPAAPRSATRFLLASPSVILSSCLWLWGELEGWGEEEGKAEVL